MIKLLMILPWLTIMFQPLNAKVEAPNYNFSLDTLSDFLPGKSAEEAEKKHGKPEQMSDVGGVLTKKFYVAHIRYKFPVLIQVKDGVILDMFAKLPSYFLHDLFFQSLVNKMGKQNTYKKVGEEAFYTWIQGDLTHLYSGACTITCFPVFYSVFPTIAKYPTMMDQMKNSVPKIPKKKLVCSRWNKRIFHVLTSRHVEHNECYG